MDEESPARSRSGSETRKKQDRVTFRVSTVEYAELVTRAEERGLTVGSYVRSRALAAPTTRAVRRVPVDLHAVGRILASLQRVGGNIYQLTRHVNFGTLPDVEEIRDAFAGHREAVTAILATLGRVSAGRLPPP